jgi:hypothetical protein
MCAVELEADGLRVPAHRDGHVPLAVVQRMSLVKNQIAAWVAAENRLTIAVEAGEKNPR